MFQQRIVGYGVLLAAFAHAHVAHDAVLNVFSYFILSS